MLIYSATLFLLTKLDKFKEYYAIFDEFTGHSREQFIITVSLMMQILNFMEKLLDIQILHIEFFAIKFKEK